MPWKAFAFFNFMGAAVWVTVIATVGYLFGKHWETLARGVQRFDLAVLFVAAGDPVFVVEVSSRAFAGC